MHKSVDRNAICDADANFPMQKARPSDGSGPRVAARIHPAGMQLRKFFVPATDVGVEVTHGVRGLNRQPPTVALALSSRSVGSNS